MEFCGFARRQRFPARHLRFGLQTKRRLHTPRAEKRRDAEHFRARLASEDRRKMESPSRAKESAAEKIVDCIWRDQEAERRREHSRMPSRSDKERKKPLAKSLSAKVRQKDSRAQKKRQSRSEENAKDRHRQHSQRKSNAKDRHAQGKRPSRKGKAQQKTVTGAILREKPRQKTDTRKAKDRHGTRKKRKRPPPAPFSQKNHSKIPSRSEKQVQKTVTDSTLSENTGNTDARRAKSRLVRRERRKRTVAVIILREEARETTDNAQKAAAHPSKRLQI